MAPAAGASLQYFAGKDLGQEELREHLSLIPKSVKSAKGELFFRINLIIGEEIQLQAVALYSEE